MGRLVWVSKIVCYENPYSVTGTIKLTGLEEKPKRKIWRIRNMERGKPLTWSTYILWSGDMESLFDITYLNNGESRGIVPVKPW